ncbi:MAG TPA: ACT domain-containing protein [Armatimonadota bacterium]
MAKNGYMALSGLGPDRPGLVAEVTRFLVERGCSVQESRMAVLGGEFGVLMLVAGAQEGLDSVQSSLADLQAQTGLRLVLKLTASPEEHRRAAVVPCQVTASSLDHEGIVYAVTNVLYRAGANIVALETTAYNAPITGSPLFRLEASVDVPQAVSLPELRASLSEVGQSENLDIELKTLVG